MKKYNAKVILGEIVFILVVSLIPSVAIALALGAKQGIVLSALPWYVLSVCFFFLLWIILINTVMGAFAKRTMEKHSESEGFGQSYTYINKDSGTVGAILRIDRDSGRVAYVSFQNPFAFQMVHASELSDFKSSYIKGPFGGTRYVYFEFWYDFKKVRIPTFTSRSMFMVTSTTVKRALAKGDEICAELARAQLVGN